MEKGPAENPSNTKERMDQILAGGMYHGNLFELNGQYFEHNPVITGNIRLCKTTDPSGYQIAILDLLEKGKNAPKPRYIDYNK